MVEITERQKEILDDVVREYIKTALPVSSGFLKEKRGLAISPATIRLDFADLTDYGFLEKQHIAGGRIPTDKAYRFFVDSLFSKLNFELEERRFLKKLAKLVEEVNDDLSFYHEVAKTLASLTSNFGIVFLPEGNIFWKEGWQEILAVPEFRNLDYLRKFVELVNELEENIDKLALEKRGEKVCVYIGKESPFKRKEFCIVAGASSGKKNKATLAILGPKRMDFKKNICLLDCLIKKVESIN